MGSLVIEKIRIAGYRSIRSLEVPLGQLNVVVGGNGCGKTNVYRSLELLSSAARGHLARAIAAEGGMPSIVWAGPRAEDEAADVTISMTGDVIGYALSFGIPESPEGSLFVRDPELRHELVWTTGLSGEREYLARRKGGFAWLKGEAEGRSTAPGELSSAESLLCQLRDKHMYPELAILADNLDRWRFYHRFRTDQNAPVRRPHVGVRTPVMNPEGDDLAAALQTIMEGGDRDLLDSCVQAAFPGAKLVIDADDKVRLTVGLLMPGVRRPLEACELSDGTLAYLCLVAGLLSPRPPPLLALNEPETSLHPDLIAPLSALIVRASRRAQVLITTHSPELTQRIRARNNKANVLQLELVDGQTRPKLS